MATSHTRSDVPVLRSGDVSRETRERLELFIRELTRWQTVKNLVGPGTLQSVWTRHVEDSLQLLDHAPQARRWLDLGSGAGFPGLVLGIVLAEELGAVVHLVESNSRKCAFLRHAARVTGAPAVIHEGRIETLQPKLSDLAPDVVTARALASLNRLLALSEPMLKPPTMGLFLKGREAASELTEAAKSWTVEADLLPSRTDPEACIIRVHSLRRGRSALD
jgi:16S rRNA (guanine527-N7)-methyltransferase